MDNILINKRLRFSDRSLIVISTYADWHIKGHPLPPVVAPPLQAEPQMRFVVRALALNVVRSEGFSPLTLR